MIQMVVYDFDGVMTDGSVFVSADGTEFVKCHRNDGYGIVLFREKGLEQVILSGEPNPVVTTRARKLGIECCRGIWDKPKQLMVISGDKNIPLENIVYLGNGLNDVESMKMVGHPACVADAHIECQARAVYKLSVKGGEGAVLALYELLTERGLL